MRFCCSCRVTILAIWALRAASSFSRAQIFCSASSLASVGVFSWGSSGLRFGKENCLPGGFSKKGRSSWRGCLDLISVLQLRQKVAVRGCVMAYVKSSLPINQNRTSENHIWPYKSLPVNLKLQSTCQPDVATFHAGFLAASTQSAYDMHKPTLPGDMTESNNVFASSCLFELRWRNFLMLWKMAN